MKEIYFIPTSMVTAPKVKLSDIKLNDKGISVDLTIDSVQGDFIPMHKDYYGFKPKAQPIEPKATAESRK